MFSLERGNKNNPTFPFHFLSRPFSFLPPFQIYISPAREQDSHGREKCIVGTGMGKGTHVKNWADEFMPSFIFLFFLADQGTIQLQLPIDEKGASKLNSWSQKAAEGVNLLPRKHGIRVRPR